MIFYVKDNVEVVREAPMGGKGQVHGRHPFKAGHGPEKTRFKMIGAMTLSPGSEIGFHVHAQDEEIYIINSGQGIFTDNDKQTYPVAPGDIMVTRQGEGHALTNNGDVPLIFTAVIAAD